MKICWLRLSFVLLVFGIAPGAALPAQSHAVSAFVHVNLLPMTQETVVPDQTVLVREARIIAVGPSQAIQIPSDATVIDGTDRYLMPGLADMHIHTDTRWLNGGWPVSPLDLFLANGVTTIRDFGPTGAPVDYALRWREEIKNGRLQGPTIFAAGPILYGPVDDAEKTVRRQHAQGFDFVKLYSFLSAAEFHEALATAQKLNLYTAGHIPFAVGLSGVLSEGMDEIAHIEELDFEFLDFDRSRTLGHEEWFRYILGTAAEMMGPLADLSLDELREKYQTPIDQIVRELAASRTPVCTTLSVDAVVVEKLFHAERLSSGPTSQFLPYGFVESLRQGQDGHQALFKGHEHFAPLHFKLNRVLMRELHAGGVLLVLGTDAGQTGMGLVPGFSVHEELRMMVEDGFSPYEALSTATVNAAAVINRMNAEGDFGTVAVGNKADLLLIAGNPLDDINALKKIEGVMASGRWFDKAALQKMITPQMPVTTAVKHVHAPDIAHYTYLDVVVGKTYPGDLPDAIDSITVTGPGGRLPVEKEDFTYLHQLRDFWIKLPGKPQIGTYTIEVRSGSKRALACDIQAEVVTIPLPPIEFLSPADGATVKSDGPTFSWGAPATNTPLYYRLEIHERRGGRIYSTGYVRNMLSHAVPQGCLPPGRSYRWRIRITDGDSWQTAQNRSHCRWRTLHVR